MLGLLGCSGHAAPADAGNCRAHAPCGGSVVGAWRFGDQCLGGIGLAPPAGFSSPVGCSGSWSSVTYASSFPWTITFYADGTYEDSYAGASSEVFLYPSSCFATEGGAIAACSAIEAALQDAIRTGADAGTTASAFLAAACALDSTGNCECRLARTDTSYHSSGVYTVVGRQLTIEATHDSRDAGSTILTEVWDYCVADNTLTLSSAPLGALVGSR